MRRFARIAGTVMVVAGLGTLGWAVAVWQWQDPFTAAVNKLEQRELEQDFERSLKG
ncbi:MAG: hypothetical protein H0T13_01950, partial [Actinobacteria bacterium]|nr:hypothetical protein [Actinomycetota bacterium]